MKAPRIPFAPVVALACLTLPIALLSEPLPTTGRPTGRLMTDAVRNAAQTPRTNVTPYHTQNACASIQVPQLASRSISSGRSFTTRTVTPRIISPRTLTPGQTVSATTVSATRAVSSPSISTPTPRSRTPSRPIIRRGSSFSYE